MRIDNNCHFFIHLKALTYMVRIRRTIRKLTALLL